MKPLLILITSLSLVINCYSQDIEVKGVVIHYQRNDSISIKEKYYCTEIYNDKRELIYKDYVPFHSSTLDSLVKFELRSSEFKIRGTIKKGDTLFLDTIQQHDSIYINSLKGIIDTNIGFNEYGNHRSYFCTITEFDNKSRIISSKIYLNYKKDTNFSFVYTYYDDKLNQTTEVYGETSMKEYKQTITTKYTKNLIPISARFETVDHNKTIELVVIEYQIENKENEKKH